MVSDLIRKQISKRFTGQKEIVFNNNVPTYESLGDKFSDIDEFGIYLHIPFCEKICPYCPYNKELYTDAKAQSYLQALKMEIDAYTAIVGKKKVTSFYIGGGTPTTMLGKGLEEILDYIYRNFNMHCQVHLESHPNHLSIENLSLIESLNVKYLSVGVEALQERHLRAIQRPYTVQEARESIERAMTRGFDCVNIDYIFDLPGQTLQEIEEAGNDIVKMGVHQAATYPLFNFDYTNLGREFHRDRNAISTMFRRRKMLRILEDIFYAADYKRSSVWAFTKNGTDKYCSVTVPLYLGLGASGSTYLKDIFYVNTFSVSEYVQAILNGKSPIALSVDLSEKMQMSGWLYWRIYETKFNKSDFQSRFEVDFDQHYGKTMKWLNRVGYLKNGEDNIQLTDKGSYWIHAFEDFFSINYINKLWGTSKTDPWPENIVL